MSERIDIYLYMYLEINKRELIGSRMRFYEIGTTYIKDSYCDYDESILYPSPILPDEAGRYPKIFIEKPYRVELVDENDKIIFDDDYENLYT